MRNQAVHDVGNVDHVVGYTESNVETRHVTANQVIDELREVKEAFEWRLTAQLRIEGVLRNSPDDRVFNPVTAVAFFRTGQFFNEGLSSAAGRCLGLSFNDCTAMVAACNYGFASGAAPLLAATKFPIQP